MTSEYENELLTAIVRDLDGVFSLLCNLDLNITLSDHKEISDSNAISEVYKELSMFKALIVSKISKETKDEL